MRVLITGSNGFLGKNLIEKIQQITDNWKIHGFDIIPMDDHSYNFEKINFNDRIDWKTKIDQIEPDYIFHLAGLFRGTKDEIFNTNTVSFFSFIEGILNSKINPKLTVMGSAAQYGTVRYEDNPINETHLTAPINIYGLTKDFQERIALYYQKNYEIDVVCIRSSSFIGKGVSSKLLSGFLTEKFNTAEQKVKIEISNASDIRDYIDVRDVSGALLKLQDIHDISGEIFNIPGTKPISNLELIKIFERISGKEAQISYSQPDKEPFRIWLDNTKLLKHTQFEHEYTIDESVQWSLS